MNRTTSPPEAVVLTTRAESSGWLDLFASVHRHVGKRLPMTFLIIALSTALEGAGLVMILPVAEIIFSQGSGGSPFSTWLLEQLRSLGIDSIAGQLGFLAALFFILLILRSLILMKRDVMMLLLSQGYVDGLRRQVFGVLARADWPVIKTYQRAQLLDSMTTNIGRISQAVNFLTQGLVTIALMVVLVISAFLVDAAIGMMLVAMATGVGVFAFLRLKKSQHLGDQMTRGNRGVMLETTRFLDGLKAAKACQAEEEFSRRFKDATDRTRQISKSFVVQQSRLRRSIELAGAIATICLLLIGYSWLALSGAELLIMGAIVIRLVPGLIAIFNGMQSVAFALPAFTAAEHIRQMIERQTSGAPGSPVRFTDPSQLHKFGGMQVRSATVFVGADGDAQCLVEAQNLTIKNTGLTHIFGPSGAGKSTLVELLTGLYLPSSGSLSMILNDELTTLDALTRPAWQSQISYAPQEPFLFSGSVRENLCWPNIEASDEEIWEALRVCLAEDLVLALPDKLGEILMDGGQRLSGGERQRLCLARALLRPSNILLLDETTSAVDLHLETKIFANLTHIAKRKAVLLVCHSVKPLEVAQSHIQVTAGSATMIDRSI